MPIRHATPPDLRLLALMGHRAAVIDGQPVAWLDGIVATDIVGESFRREAFILLFGLSPPEGWDIAAHAVLMPELTNPYDPHALSVRIQGRVVGYLSRDDVRWRHAVLRLMERLHMPIAVSARVAGIGEKPCVRVLLPDDLEVARMILELPHFPSPTSVFIGDEEHTMEIVGERYYKEGLRRLVAASAPGARLLATLHANGSVSIAGIRVGFIGETQALWQTFVIVLERRYQLPVTCPASIRPGQRGYQVTLGLSSLC